MGNHKSQDVGRESMPTNADGAWTSEAIAVGVLTRKGRGFHILTAGQLNFKDGDAATVNMAAGFWTVGAVYAYEVTEILAGTTATGRVLY